MDTRAWSWHRQKLGTAQMVGASAAAVLAESGWARTVGGTGPYLGLRARAGLDRAAIEAELLANSICELPAARGCTYLVPAADYAVALQAGAGGPESEIALAKKHLGVSDKELDKLADAVVAATARGPLDPRELKESLGDLVRNLGDAGKKRGMTTTLPLALGRLVGVWEYDFENHELVWATFGKIPGISKVAGEVSTFIAEDLGDVRSFSLDSPESRGPRLKAIRALTKTS